MNVSQVAKKRLNANGDNKQPNKKSKRKWMIPLLILGGVVLIATTGVGVGLGVKSCEDKKHDDEKITPLEKAEKYLKDNQENFSITPDDWSGQQPDYQPMLNYFNEQITTKHFVCGIVDYCLSRYVLAETKMSQQGGIVEMTAFDVSKVSGKTQVGCMICEIKSGEPMVLFDIICSVNVQNKKLSSECKETGSLSNTQLIVGDTAEWSFDNATLDSVVYSSKEDTNTNNVVLIYRGNCTFPMAWNETQDIYTRIPKR